MIMSVLPLTASAENTISGALGKLNWSINLLDNVLTIDCDGNMPNFESHSSPAPWYDYRDHINSVVFLEGLTSIGEDAFYECENITSLDIVEGVVSIGDYAFMHCSALTSVTVPTSLKSVGSRAFDYCYNIKSVNIKDLTAWLNINFSVFGGNIPGTKYLNGQPITEVTIPESVTKINTYSLAGLNLLTSVTIPDWVTDIGYYAFLSCKLLSSVVIGNGVKSIGSDAFSGCTSLSSVTIGNSVTEIRGSAFSNCTSLQEITIPVNVTDIQSEAFSGCTGLQSIYIYNRSCKIRDNAIPANATVYGYMGSTAQTYADKNGLIFKELEGTHTHKYVATSVVEATCIVNGATTFECACGDKKTEVITAPGHAAVTVPEVKATCTSEGYASWSYCSVCNDTIVEKITIPAISHTIVTSGNVPASCGKEGFTGIEYCAICNNVLSTGEVVPATNAHIPAAAEEIVVMNASCGKAGSKLSIIKCSECGKTISSETVEIPKTNAHTPAEAEEYILSDATCTKNGTKKIVISCSTCSDVLSESIEVITAHGHCYNTNTIEPDCTTNGYTIYTCIHNDSEYVSDFVNAVGHNDTNNDNLCDICNCKMPEQTENNNNNENTPDINININTDSSKQNFFESLWAFILNLINMLKGIFVR